LGNGSPSVDGVSNNKVGMVTFSSRAPRTDRRYPALDGRFAARAFAATLSFICCQASVARYGVDGLKIIQTEPNSDRSVLQTAYFW